MSRWRGRAAAAQCDRAGLALSRCMIPSMDFWLTKINLNTGFHYFHSMDQTTTNLQADNPTLKTFLRLLSLQVYSLKQSSMNMDLYFLFTSQPSPAFLGSFRITLLTQIYN